MKKTLLIVAVFLIAGSTAFSQVQFGVGGMAGTKAGMNDNFEQTLNFGPHVRALFNVGDKFGVTAGFSYYLPVKYSGFGAEVTMNYMAFNADALYYILNDDDFKVYALGGVNYGMIKLKFADMGADDGNGTANHTDFEVGGGIQVGKIFAEVKYDNSNEHFQAFLGIYF